MTFPRLTALTDNMKTLQPMPEGMKKELYDLIMLQAIDKLLNDIAAFINAPVEEIPQALDSSMLLKLAAWFNDSGIFIPNADRLAGSVKTINEGDASVTFNSPMWAMSKLSEFSVIDDDFIRTLVKYRRLAGWDNERGARAYDTTL